MEKKDYSRVLYEKFFNTKGRILKITLNDNSVMEGIFIAFFHGDEEAKEPFISKWHFIREEDIPEYKKFTGLDTEDSKRIIINQEDIKNVSFK